MKYFLFLALAFVICTTLTSAWLPRGWRQVSLRRQNNFGFMPRTGIQEEDTSDPKPFRQTLRRSGPHKNTPTVCESCLPGFGLVSMCNETSRTECRECTLGVEYSPSQPHFSQCMFCSKCGINMYEDVPCSTTSDTFCDSCSTKKGARNADYWRRCPEIDNNEVFSRLGTDDDDASFDLDHANFQKDLGSSESEELLKPLDNSKPMKNLLDKELTGVYREINQELDQISKEEKELDNLDKELPKVYKETQKELDQLFDNDDNDDDNDEILKIPVNNTQQLENAVDQSVRDMPYFPANDNNPNQRNLDDDDSYIQPLRIDGDYQEPKTDEIVFKPSNHGYPYEELVHPYSYREKQVKKVIWLYGITAVMLVVALLFITCYAGSYYKRRRAAYRFAAVQLNDHDNQVIRQCAQRLENDQVQPVDRKRRNPFDRADNKACMNVFENPLEEYLEDDQPFNGSQESLIPNVHKSTKLETV